MRIIQGTGQCGPRHGEQDRDQEKPEGTHVFRQAHYREARRQSTISNTPPTTRGGVDWIAKVLLVGSVGENKMLPAHPEPQKTEQTPKRDAESKLQWVSRLDRHLAQAAKLASEYGVPPDAFATAAWNAYLHESPALAEHIEKMKFLAGVEELRNQGRLAKA